MLFMWHDEGDPELCDRCIMQRAYPDLYVIPVTCVENLLDECVLTFRDRIVCCMASDRSGLKTGLLYV